MKRAITAVVGFALVVMVVTGIVWVGGVAYANAGETSETVDNESITADVGNWVEVQDSPDHTWDYDDDETVFNSSDVELTEGDSDGSGDYDWNESDGTIRFHNTQNVTDGESMNITYTWNAKIETARSIQGAFELVIPVLPLLMLAALGMAVITIAAVGARHLMGASRRSRNGGLGR